MIRSKKTLPGPKMSLHVNARPKSIVAGSMKLSASHDGEKGGAVDQMWRRNDSPRESVFGSVRRLQSLGPAHHLPVRSKRPVPASNDPHNRRQFNGEPHSTRAMRDWSAGSALDGWIHRRTCGWTGRQAQKLIVVFVS